MAGLSDSPVLSFKNKWRVFTVTDETGSVVAETVPVQDAGEGKGRLARFFSNTGDLGLLVLRLSDPAGAPLFFIERAGIDNPQVHTPRDGMRTGPGGHPMLVPKGQPVHIAAPDSSRLGTIEEDEWFVRESRFGDTYGGRRHKIVDGRQNVLCSVVWEPMGYASQNGYDPDQCDYFGPDGTKLAHLEKGVLNVYQKLPEPFHSLVAVSPIAFEIAGP